ncbi:MAG: hypothetical protein JNK67_14075 [Alphaproteobacteria bacterium]|nr:hypothetical protein [Alphaproteobacteria bacterium]
MRTPASLRGCGAARPILGHILEIARARGRRDLLLDTGKHSAFEPAQRLCRSVGFASRGPFPDNVENGRSTFMHLTLADMSPRWAG